MIHAIGIDPLNPAGRPNPASIKSLGFNGVRSVFFDQADWYSYHQAAKRAGLKTIITLAKESFSGRPHAEVIGNLPVDADYVVVGNEPDGEGDSSWTMSPSSFRSLIRECAPLIEMRCPSARIVAGGLVSGQVSWLEPIYRDLAQLVDYLDIHPYNKTADDAQALLVNYYTLTGIPMMVLEWNRPTDQIREFADMLAIETEAAAYFCWSDGMVDGFGLVDRHGSPKPELTAMIEALAQPSEPPLPPLPPHPPSDGFSVGDGMRALMAKRGDRPAADEIYFKNPAGKDQWSECMAASGRLYRYVFSVNKTFSFSAEPD